jgi:hypothetical protein
VNTRSRSLFRKCTDTSTQNPKGVGIDPNYKGYKGKGLQLQFTVEDTGVFTMPWSAVSTYRRAAGEWAERVCAKKLRATQFSTRSDGEF